MNDRPIHCKTQRDHQENCETLKDYILTQSEADGLNQLINWLQGFEAARSGQIPGHFELIMHYRNMAGNISDQRALQKKQNE